LFKTKFKPQRVYPATCLPRNLFTPQLVYPTVCEAVSKPDFSVANPIPKQPSPTTNETQQSTIQISAHGTVHDQHDRCRIPAADLLYKVNEQKSTQQNSNLEPAIVDVFKTNSQVQFRIGAVHTNDLDEIKTLLNGFTNKSEGAFVRVAGNVPYESAAQAIGICRASGFKSVSYLPLE